MTGTAHRLRKHADYQFVYKGSRKQFGKQFAYFFMARPDGRRSETDGPRIGLTVPKALGKAVDRNRIKRRLREAVREALPLLHEAPIDIILHPKRGVRDVEFPAVQREVTVIFRSVLAAVERDAQKVKRASEAGEPA